VGEWVRKKEEGGGEERERMCAYRVREEILGTPLDLG